MNEALTRSDIFVVIPVFNERQVIRAVIESLLPHAYTVVVVDDGSTDGTGDVISDLDIVLLRHRFNLGQGAALQTGIDFAARCNASIVVTFDGDGQHQAADIPAVIQPLLLNETDAVLGSRFLPGALTNMSATRRVVIGVARLLHFLITGLWLSDAHNGFRAFNRKAITKIRFRQNRMAHASEVLIMLHEHKLRILEVPVTIFYSDYSRAKGQPLLNGLRILMDLLLNRIFD
ncbi:MAG TPA: glycosyltransferase family 2 protein [Chitinophagaceae bacterium]